MKTLKNIKLIFLIFIGIHFLSSCRNDSLITNLTESPSIPEKRVEAHITGFITDLNGIAIKNAKVSVINNSVFTDDQGAFNIIGLVNERHAIINIEKNGYFKQFKTISLTSSKTSITRTRIQLIEKTVTEIISSSTPEIVDLGSNSSVKFQANSFVDELNNPYNGQVTIFSYYIDPTHPNIDQFMPGNLMAINADQELNILKSFGMVNIEIEGQAGQKLQINKNATLTVGVPNSLAVSAPSTIPLWYFDEDMGVWIEEGSADLINGRYVGEVSHFTFWNCDIPSEVSFVTGKITNEFGPFLTKVQITNLANGAKYSNWTNSEGYFSGFIPRNRDLLLEVIGFCGEDDIISSSNINPVTDSEFDLGNFEVTNNSSYAFISGTLLNCDNEALNVGTVIIEYPNQNFSLQTFTNEIGEFGESIPFCDNELVIIQGINLEESYASNPFSTTLDGSSQFEFGDIKVCENISANLGYVELIYGERTKVFDNCTITTKIIDDIPIYAISFQELIPPLNTPKQYEWGYRDLNNDLTNPDWELVYILQSPNPNSGLEDTYYTYTTYPVLDVSEIELVSIADNPGEIMELKISEVTLELETYEPNIPVSTQIFTNCSLTFKGVTQ